MCLGRGPAEQGIRGVVRLLPADDHRVLIRLVDTRDEIVGPVAETWNCWVLSDPGCEEDVIGGQRSTVVPGNAAANRPRRVHRSIWIEHQESILDGRNR